MDETPRGEGKELRAGIANDARNLTPDPFPKWKGNQPGGQVRDGWNLRASIVRRLDAFISAPNAVQSPARIASIARL